MTCYGQASPAPVKPQRAPAPAPAAAEPSIIPGGGASIQATYWLPQGQPKYRKGEESTSTGYGDLNLPGKKWVDTPGVMLSIPAGRQNTLRFSFYRSKSNGDVITPVDLDLVNVGYKAGDYLVTKYKTQYFKMSWDYLSYTFDSSKVRFKTLWEVQYSGVEAEFDAPIKDPTGGSFARAEKYFIVPTFGMGLEQAPSKHFRWEMKGSGFGWPGSMVTWDADASIGIRIGSGEIILGGKAFSMKTSPKSEFYFRQTMPGAYVGFRWYWDQGGQ